MKNKVKYNLTFIIALVFGIIIYLYYIDTVSYNIPFMDYWRIILRTINMMDKNISFKNIIWESDFGQRNPLLISSLILNIKYTNLNCRISEYLAVIPMTITCIMIYKRWIRNIEIKKSLICYQALFSVLLIISIFNLNQWEILHIQFAFPFMTRICIYVLVFYLVDQAIVDNNQRINKKKIIISGIIAILAICGLSQLYFVAFILSIWIVLILHYLISKKNNINVSFKHILIWIGLSFLGLFIYFYNVDMTTSGTSNIEGYIQIIFNGQLFIGILYMFAAIILPQSLIEKLDYTYINIIGILFLCILILSIFQYFYTKIYEESYLPILMILYGSINIGIIALGRLKAYGTYYLTSSRYVVESTLILSGIIFIITRLLINRYKKRGINILIFFIILGIVSCMLFSIYSEISTAKYRRFYKESFVNVLKDIDNATDEDIIGLQAEPKYIRELIPILEERNLSLFYKDNSVSIFEGFK